MSLKELKQAIRDGHQVVRHDEFGDNVLRARDLELLESEHFLIWTDWQRSERPLLTRWAEAMHAALSNELGLDPNAEVFLAKCHILRQRGTLPQGSQKFDGLARKPLATRARLRRATYTSSRAAGRFADRFRTLRQHAGA
jgi:hypothetical protein